MRPNPSPQAACQRPSTAVLWGAFRRHLGANFGEHRGANRVDTPTSRLRDHHVPNVNVTLGGDGGRLAHADLESYLVAGAER